MRRIGSIFISVIKKQSGKLVRKPSGGERAWFLEEESEPRNKWIFLAGENTRADESVCLTSKEIVTEIGMLTGGLTYLTLIFLCVTDLESIHEIQTLRGEHRYCQKE